MSLVPYALRPRAVLRKAAHKRGVEGGSVLWRALPMYYVGGPTLLRTNAIRRGVLGGDRKWQAAGLVLLITQDLRHQAGRGPERLGKWKVGPNDFLRVAVEKPLSKKERKRLGVTRESVVEQAVADTAAAVPDARIVVKTR